MGATMTGLWCANITEQRCCCYFFTPMSATSIGYSQKARGAIRAGEICRYSPYRTMGFGGIVFGARDGVGLRKLSSERSAEMRQVI